MAHDDLQNGRGKIISDRHVALYRDDQGRLHATTSICTHHGCDVEWNDQEKVWDCPCHGSQFTPTGEVIRGPAVLPLSVAAIPD